MDGSSSLIMSVPNIITSNPGGGRFDFDDGGTYCGGWQDGKAHGHGVCTGPKNVGEYSGSWNFGFEMSGVYKWTNGAVYEGRWQNGKRHGVGVEYNGKWIYKGEWSQGFKGRYGVKASSNSAVKYEGTWANGLQDGYGSETYSDGGYYQGQMCRGLRHGYGVRKSAPYGDSQLNNPNKNGQLSGTTTTTATNSMLIHSNSLQSTGSVDLQDDSPKPEDGFKPNIDRTLASKNGFVLVAKPLDVPVSKYNDGGHDAGHSKGSRRSSLTNKLASARIPGSNQTASLLRGLRLRKQKSTSDLDALGGGSSGHRSQQHQHHHDNRSSSSRTGGASHQISGDDLLQASIPFSLSPEELDITDPTTVETYTGEWKHDKRNGHGVCDRSDGLKYEGQWHNDMKCGYGVTTFKNGTKEEGGANIRQRIDEAVKMAQQAQTMALKKAEIADTRAATARDKADQATTAAVEAARDSQIAYSVARQYSTDSNNLLAGSNLMGGGPMGMLNVGGVIPAMSSGALISGMDPMMPNLNMASNPLQMRRISQQQQQQQQQYQQQANYMIGQYEQMDSMMQHNQGEDHHQHLYDQQFNLGPNPIEPFNGRRGSFRGGSQPPGGSGGGRAVGFAQPTSNYGGQKAAGPSQRQASSSTSDPFNDLFDHYKSNNQASGNHSNQFNYSRSSRRGFGSTRQTSLDYNHMRQASVPRQMGSSAAAASGAVDSYRDRMRQFRMSSMDHAEENHQMAKQQSLSPQDSNSISISPQQNFNNNQSNLSVNNQEQFKHLVTSGEEQQQQQQQQSIDQQRQPVDTISQQQTDSLRITTPTSSTYIPQQSTNSSMFGTQTPSPVDTSTGFRPSSGGQQYNSNNNSNNAYNEHRTNSSMASYPLRGYPVAGGGQFASHLMRQHQRDVHSLADEQLYISAGRRAHGGLLDNTEFSNYDFTITSGPRMAQRCIRRTASLSRHSLVHAGSELRASANLASSTMNNTLVNSPINQLRQQDNHQQQRSFSPIPSIQQPRASHRDSASRLTATEDSLHQSLHQHQRQANNNNNNNQNNLLDPDSYNSGSRLTIDSAGSSGPLIRKPSLQVRYDPIALGGLMSREEVAALSHAQREQKRIEMELAERRAKRPLLHLYLSLREFISKQRLILSVLLINACLFKLFADLVT